MKASDVKLGAVYRFAAHDHGENVGQLCVVVKLVHGLNPGAHLRLTLSGRRAGRAVLADYASGPFAYMPWEKFELVSKGE